MSKLKFNPTHSLTVMAVTCAMIAGSFGAVHAAEQNVKLRIIGTLPITSYATEGLKNFAKQVEKESGGTITMETYPAQQLYSDKDAPDVIPSGAVDMGVVNTDFWTGLAPSIAILMIPTLYDSYDSFYKSRERMLPTINKDLEKRANSRIVGWFNYSTQTIGSKTPILKLADFKNKKMRGWGEYSSEFFRFVGSSPIVMSSSDVYDGLSKGAIDGEMSAWVSQYDRKFYEVANNFMDMSLLPVTNYAIVINTNSWNKLSDRQKKALENAGKESDLWSRKQNELGTKEAIEKIKAKNTHINEISQENFVAIRDAALPKLQEHYFSKAGDIGKQLWEMVAK